MDTLALPRSSPSHSTSTQQQHHPPTSSLLFSLPEILHILLSLCDSPSLANIALTNSTLHAATRRYLNHLFLRILPSTNLPSIPTHPQPVNPSTLSQFISSDTLSISILAAQDALRLFRIINFYNTCSSSLPPKETALKRLFVSMLPLYQTDLLHHVIQYSTHDIGVKLIWEAVEENVVLDSKAVLDSMAHILPTLPLSTTLLSSNTLNNQDAAAALQNLSEKLIAKRKLLLCLYQFCSALVDCTLSPSAMNPKSSQPPNTALLHQFQRTREKLEHTFQSELELKKSIWKNRILHRNASPVPHTTTATGIPLDASSTMHEPNEPNPLLTDDSATCPKFDHLTFELVIYQIIKSCNR
ncbi:hypothetical protein BKA69DRAFT_1127002 [Paraphysoderma sedebokerense]|nr:hypothetical protein BKA69DRAFT_1127002 [Paraphysoderma sedebokerense]